MLKVFKFSTTATQEEIQTQLDELLKGLTEHTLVSVNTLTSDATSATLLLHLNKIKNMNLAPSQNRPAPMMQAAPVGNKPTITSKFSQGMSTTDAWVKKAGNLKTLDSLFTKESK